MPEAVVAQDNFATQFAHAWATPSPQKLAALLHDNVTLLQPHRPPVRGKHAAIQEFERLFTWLPGLHGEIERSSQEGDYVFIEWKMKLPIAGKLISIPAVDRFRLKEGLGIERIVYFDQMALIANVVREPHLWLGYLKYRWDSR